MRTKTLGPIRWVGLQLYADDEYGGTIELGYVGGIREQDREHIERCLHRAYKAGRSSLGRDIRELIGG